MKNQPFKFTNSFPLAKGSDVKIGIFFIQIPENELRAIFVCLDQRYIGGRIFKVWMREYDERFFHKWANCSKLQKKRKKLGFMHGMFLFLRDESYTRDFSIYDTGISGLSGNPVFG